MNTILLADNDPDFLRNRSEKLEQEGYRVIPALSLTEARRVLDQGGIDIAIVDIRMENDDDGKDISGLTLAKDPAYRSIPKIILTGFPNVNAVKEALGPALDGLPPAVDFLTKDDGPEVMVQTVRKSLAFANEWLHRTLNDITQQLTDDYEVARRQSHLNYWASLGVALLGIVIIFLGTALALAGIQTLGIASAVGGVITEAISYLFFTRVDTSNKRMDSYHSESLHTKRFENLLASCDEISSLEKRESCKENVIDSARAYWFEIHE